MTRLLLIFAAAVAGVPFAAAAEVTTVSDKCPAPAAASKDGKTMAVDDWFQKGRTDHAINTKGTGTGAGRAAPDHAINTKGTGSAGRAAADHAINTKGTGTGAGRAAPDHAINTKGTGSAGRAAADHAINTKGTGSGAGRAAASSGSSVDQEQPTSDSSVGPGSSATYSSAPPVVIDCKS